MTVETDERKTIEESKLFCLDVRNRRESAIEIIHEFTEVIDYENLLKSLPIKIETAKKVTVESNREVDKLELEVDSKALFNNQFKDNVDTKGTELSTLTSEVNSLKSSVETREENIVTINNLKNEIEQLEKDKVNVDSKMNELESELLALEQEISSMQDDFANNEEEEKDLYSKKTDLLLELKSLTKEVKDIESAGGQKVDLNKLIIENAKISKKNNKLKNILDHKNQAKSKLNAEVETLKAKTDEITTALNESNSKAETLEETVLPQEEIDKLQATCNEVSRERDRLNLSVNKLEDELESAEGVSEEIEKVNNELQTLQNEFNEFKAKVELFQNDPKQFENLKNSILELEKVEIEFREKATYAEKQLTNLSNQADIAAMKMKGYKEPLDNINNILNS